MHARVEPIASGDGGALALPLYTRARGRLCLSRRASRAIVLTVERVFIMLVHGPHPRNHRRCGQNSRFSLFKGDPLSTAHHCR